MTSEIRTSIDNQYEIFSARGEASQLWGSKFEFWFGEELKYPHIMKPIFIIPIFALNLIIFLFPISWPQPIFLEFHSNANCSEECTAKSL